MTQLERAMEYLAQDPVHYVDLIEALRRDTGTLVDALEDGLLVYEQVSGAWMMSVQSEGAYRRLMPQIPAGCELCVGHERWYQEELAELLGLDGSMVCHNAAWPGRTAPERGSFAGEIRFLTEEYTAWVAETYCTPENGTEEDYVRGAIKRGMLGAFVEGRCAGFIGFHDEGSMGLLEVLPQYRRQGVGEALERSCIALALERNKIPYGQVVEGNRASLSLQRKVGMEVSDKTLFWLFPS